jgi:hypothetical protein
VPDGTVVAGHRVVVARSIALLSLAVLSAACSPDSAPGRGADGGQVDADAGRDALDAAPEHHLMPEVAHSGFDGTNSYQVPVYSTLEDAVFDIDDDAIAAIEPVDLPPDLEEVLGTFGKSWAMITTSQAGTASFSATAGEIRLEATLEVLAYDPDDVAVGSERYNDPVNPNDTTRIACQDCHGGPDGVDHTPLAAAYFEDSEMLQIIADGVYPEGGEVNGGNHHWNLTEAEAAGIVPYLRSLQPRGF